MAFTPLTYDQITANILRDIANRQPDADTGADSDYAIRANASASASAVEGLYQYQAWIAKQIFPDTADSDMLARHARTRGLSKKQATAAAGSILLSGQPGAPVTATLIAQTLDGNQYQTTATGTLGADGTLTLTASAVTAGRAGNETAGATLTLLSPPNGVNSAGSVVSLVGGTDEETDADLLARLLDVIQRPPAGGNQWDFRRWAMNVDGVSSAFVYPLRRGLGTCDVVITSSGGLPSSTTLAAVQSYIDSMRPVTAKNCLAIAPTIVTLDHVIQVAFPSGTADQAKALVQPVLASYFAGLVPGASYIRSQVEALVSGVSGVTDRLLLTPSANVVPEADANAVQWCQLGTLNVSLMP
ncbi:baseplate J/gp47 family protein [Paludibacterium yongneupense]|uniref:baseplate J/gp47 family protein n=1 Tax=Paludibacterium yongneupense TaxID=400061 RepID=UPI0003FFE66C|nr:baseplate J/gp47 family protein [Paludibacterium yongneupense]